MITGFDVTNAMKRSYGLANPEPETASQSLIGRAFAQVWASSFALFIK